MFCPKCGDEFRPGFTRCPDCQLSLVKEPPVEEAQEEVELITVATFRNALEASAARGALESRGIPAFSPDETIGTFSRLQTTGWAELKVRREDRERAEEVLESLGHD